MVKEEDAIRKFVVKQLQQCSDLSALTLGILRRRYLQQVGRESLNMKDNRFMKKIVEEELLKMQVSSDDEPLVKFVAPPKIQSKRKRVDDDGGDEGLENKLLGRTKRSHLDETSPDSPDSGIEKMNEAGQKEEEAGSDHTDEDNEEEQEKKSTMKKVTQQKQNKSGGKQSSKERDNKKKKIPEKRRNKLESEEEEDDELDDSDEEGEKQNTARKGENIKKDEEDSASEEKSDKLTKNCSSESADERGKSKKKIKKKRKETDAVKEIERQVFGSSSETEDENKESTKMWKRSSSESEATAESEEEKDKREDAADLSSKVMENNKKKKKLQENQEEEAEDSYSSLSSLEDEEEQEKDKKEGKQKSITKLCDEGESATRGKEPSADSDSYSPSDGNNTDTWTSTHEKPSFFEAEPWPSTPLSEATICGAESTALREEPLPSTFTLRPQGKMLDESSSEESTNLLRTIGKTLENLASQENTNDAISAYCKNLEHRMRNLPPHLLPHFQHEVDNCIFKYSVGQNHALERSL